MRICSGQVPPRPRPCGRARNFAQAPRASMIGRFPVLIPTRRESAISCHRWDKQAVLGFTRHFRRWFSTNRRRSQEAACYAEGGSPRLLAEKHLMLDPGLRAIAFWLPPIEPRRASGAARPPSLPCNRGHQFPRPRLYAPTATSTCASPATGAKMTNQYCPRSASSGPALRPRGVLPPSDSIQPQPTSQAPPASRLA